ncbi:MAG: GNAT family N-acetyltransferase [Gemmatimonadaceae bacterium]|nr:GNAT family N-acetyltransferase [Gemmatimonadaceae bacterium]
MKFRDATADDAPVLAALHNATAGALVARFGDGPWNGVSTERGVLNEMRHARIRVGIEAKKIVCSLRLATKKPWAIDVSYFTPVPRAIYLTGMAVAVAHQGRGVGRLALVDALEVVREWPATAIRLDAWDATAGAGGFYGKCGYANRGHAVYRGTPLVYYEMLV